MMKVSSAKAKGRRLQQWVCERLSQISGIPWGSDDDMNIQSRPMAQSGVDVILRGEAADRFPFSFECKSSETFSFKEAVKQARDNQKKGTDWVLVHKRKQFKKPLVIIDWDLFERLIEK